MYDKLSAIGHITFPPPSQKSVNLLVPPRDLGKVASESLLPELSKCQMEQDGDYIILY